MQINFLRISQLSLMFNLSFQYGGAIPHLTVCSASNVDMFLVCQLSHRWPTQRTTNKFAYMCYNTGVYLYNAPREGRVIPAYQSLAEQGADMQYIIPNASIDRPSLCRYTAIIQPFLNQFAKSWAHWKEDIEIYQMRSGKSKLAQIARRNLNVLFPMSPRFCKLIEKWLNYSARISALYLKVHFFDWNESCMNLKTRMLFQTVISQSPLGIDFLSNATNFSLIGPPQETRVIEIKILGEKKANVPLVFFGPRGLLYNHWEDPEDAAFYLCNLLAILAVMYAAFAAVAFRGLEGVKKQKKEGIGMIEKAINQFKVFKNCEARDIALAFQLRNQISFALNLCYVLTLLYICKQSLAKQTETSKQPIRTRYFMKENAVAFGAVELPPQLNLLGHVISQSGTSISGFGQFLLNPSSSQSGSTLMQRVYSNAVIHSICSVKFTPFSTSPSHLKSHIGGGFLAIDSFRNIEFFCKTSRKLLQLSFIMSQNLKSKDAIVFTQFAIYQSQSFKITQYHQKKLPKKLLDKSEKVGATAWHTLPASQEL
eukprot:sb/3463701/